MTKVLLIAANRLLRVGLCGLLVEEGFEVQADMATAREAIETAAATTPDIVLFDASGYKTVGDEVSALRKALPGAPVVVLAGATDSFLLREALTAGADGFLTLETSSSALAQWLHYVISGGKAYPRDMAEILARPPDGGGTEQVGGKSLSPRELDILAQLVDGHSNKAIAMNVGITEATVKVHLKSVLRKIGAANRTQAAIWAMNNGLARQAADPQTSAR